MNCTQRRAIVNLNGSADAVHSDKGKTEMGTRIRQLTITMLISLGLVATGTLAVSSIAGAAPVTAATSVAHNGTAQNIAMPPRHPAAASSFRQPTGNWAWYGYRLNRTETNQIANVSLWNAFWGVKGSALIPYSTAIMGTYAVNWVLTARNARSIGQCLGISYVGVGLIVGCP